MKTYHKTSVSKLVAKFDNDLKALLLQDLQAVRNTKNDLINKIKQSIEVKSLSAA
ncbi:hypothetical protein HH214_01185 [Mucilaginibacter robiniae]|uniref:Uncharacterized protein n=1 Tax=Mucilaginibacter robiniae TaxID=2728022 RepID=A0A7L5DTZ8_9SPHI|nr:hypothetical protein [Mucilaginibacter robiniae]QJD94585.1 hypothetical protein HH214_01185 [Mucilaginibacter robiniae]